MHKPIFLLMLTLGALISAHAEVWVTGPSHVVARNEAKPEASETFDAKTKTVKLFAARNEFVAFQIVFSGELKGVNLEPFVLTGPDKKTLDHVQLYREHYLPCPIVTQYDANNRPPDVEAWNKRCQELKYPREFPEQLVPLNAKKYGAPFDVAKDRNEVIWTDIFVPEDAPSGVYKGTLNAAGETLNIELAVWNFTLPSVSHFPNWVYIGPEEIAWAFGKHHSKLAGELRPIYDQYFQMAHDHRVCLLEEWRNDDAYVKTARGYWDHATGKAFKGPFAAGMGFELIELDNDDPYDANKLKEQGWLNRAFVFLHPDEPNNKEAYDEVRANGNRVAKASGGLLRRLVTEQYEPSQAAFGRLDEAVDIFCSGGIPVHSVPEIEKKGKIVWTYNAGHAGAPNTDAPGPASRTHAWAGFITGARVWFYWDGGYVVDKQFKYRSERRAIYAAQDPSKYLTDTWTTAMTFDETLRNNGRYPARDALRMNGEGILFYPGRDAGIDGPLACFRLKNIRQGSTDFEYLYLLEKAGKADAAIEEARKLLGTGAAGAKSSDGQQSGAKRFNQYEMDGAKWDAARIRLGKLLHEIGDKALREKINPYNQYPNPVGHPTLYDGKRY